MSGHSKWSSIKHKKGAVDAKRSKVFTKVIRELTIASRMGGDDPSANPRLRSAIALAKSVNMPNENIAKAVKKGSGTDKSENWENVTYEGYGPHNVAVIVDCLTDNRNRTISSIRTIFNKNNGNLGSANSVMYMFDRVGLIEIEKSVIDEDTLMEHILEAGAEDLDTSDDQYYEIRTAPTDLHQIHTYLEEKSITIIKSNISLVPQNTVLVNETDKAKQIINFIDSLEDDDDVQNVYSNFDLTDEVIKELDS